MADDTAVVPVKPGVQTSEFWITIAIGALGGVMGTGLITNNTAVQIAGIAAALLKAALYTWSRTQVKS